MNQASGLNLEGETTATKVSAAAFFAFILYFTADHYFFLNEYFVLTPPYWVFVTAGIVGGGIAFPLIRRTDPKRTNSHLYALILGAAVGLAAYPGTARICALAGSGELQNYDYVLGDDLVWRTDSARSPEIDMDAALSKYWRQFEPGDTYQFQLRSGAFGVWLINMERIYLDQQQFYGCEGVLQCAFTF